MANFYLSWSVNNLTGNTGYKILYKLYQDSAWNTMLTSGTVNNNTVSALLPGLLDNRIYDWQVVNLSQTLGNPASLIAQICGITDPSPALSVTNTTLSYTFNNLSQDITGYSATISLYTNPSAIIATHQLIPQTTITDAFTGLQPLTTYYLNLTPSANQFTRQFTYTFSTAASSVCAPPLSASAFITSGGTLSVNWYSPTPLPANGFAISYRRNGDPSYSTYLTSGVTSGNTQVFSLTPACYEGYIQSECSSTSSSIGVPFGTNSYEKFNTSVAILDNGNSTVTVTTPLGNPYSHLINGNFVYTTSGTPHTQTFSVTYGAGNTTQTFTLLTTIPKTATLGAINITGYAPLFNNGGQLQQFDNLLTPPYFQLRNGLTSGTTWNGDPMLLPSFTLDQFSPTQTDQSGNVLAGQLQVSWIYHSVFNNGAIPNDTVTLIVRDPADSTILGSVTFSPTPIGLRSATLNLTKTTTPITTNNYFFMICTNSTGTPFDTLQFYLPSF